MKYIKVKGGIRLTATCRAFDCELCEKKRNYPARCPSDFTKTIVKSRVIKPLNKTGIVPAKGGKHGKG
jgi:hypothetical protein